MFSLSRYGMQWIWSLSWKPWVWSQSIEGFTHAHIQSLSHLVAIQQHVFWVMGETHIRPKKKIQNRQYAEIRIESGTLKRWGCTVSCYNHRIWMTRTKSWSKIRNVGSGRSFKYLGVAENEQWVNVWSLLRRFSFILYTSACIKSIFLWSLYCPKMQQSGALWPNVSLC